MPSMSWLLAIVATCILIAFVNKLTKGVVYGILQIVGMITLAVIMVSFLSLYEFIKDQIDYATQKIEKWWSTAAVISAALIILTGLSVWAWMFWFWLFNL